MRSFVSFESDLGRESTPAGRELAELVRQALKREPGMHTQESLGDEGYGWRVDCRVDSQRLFVLVQLSSDRQGTPCWLAIAAPLTGLLARVFRRDSGANLARLCAAVHRTLDSDSRIRSIRWYARDEWDRGIGGASAP